MASTVYSNNGYQALLRFTYCYVFHFSALCYGHFLYKGLHCQVMELLECNIRSVIFKNERQGLSAWATQKFARDVLT